MKEQLISFETAKLARKAGFPWHQPHSRSGYYSLKTGSYFHFGRQGKLTVGNSCSAPTQSLLQKWLREHKRIHIELQMLSINNWHLMVGECGRILTKGNGYRSYEKALEKGLQEALKLINNGQNRTGDNDNSD